MTDVEQPPQNGIDLSAAEDDDNNKARPVDIEQDMREMERRKRVEAIMGSKLFREELERIVDSAREGGATGILQQLSDMVGIPTSRVGNVYKSSNCLLPINDIRGVESMGYAKGEKILRCKLAATFRLLDLYGWTQGLGAQITARLKVDQEYFLVNPYGLLYHEITASSLNKVDMQGQIVEQGTTNFGVNKSHFVLHSVVHAARPDIRCAIYVGCSPVVAVSSLKAGLLPLTKDACVLGEISTHHYTGSLLDAEERDKLVRSLGPNSKVMLLTNHGALCCGETIEEAFYAACHIVQACETQLKLLPVGVDNLVLLPEESRKIIYDQSRRPPEDLEKKFAAALATVEAAQQQQQEEGGAQDAAPVVKVNTSTAPKWRVGGAEFEALMRMLDNAGYRTGYIYRHPLVKSDPPKPKNDVELPPAVSSLGYLLEEEELFRQGIWKKGDIRKGGDRSRWLNSPNVYQKVEVLETGTPDPKKITKWVAEGSPTHSTPVRIEDPLQFVPAGTNPKEFKRLQQQIKDNRRADKISAGPQSHILEGVTWDEANRIKDATVSSAGDHVVLMGAASKGIIQRGFQHNVTVYKAPYAKNPFDNVTDDELNEYKRTVERKKKSIHGEYTDTDFSESEALSSLQTSGAQQTKQNTTTTTAAVSQSEPEDISEHQVMRIETQQAPVPSQAEVVLSDAHHIHIYTHPYTSNHQSHQPMPTQHNLKIYKHLVSQHEQMSHNISANASFAQKYAFLYANPFNSFYANVCVQLFMIHKIEIFPHYTYPLTNNTTTHNNNNGDDEHSVNLQQELNEEANYADPIMLQAALPTLLASHSILETPPLTPTIPPYRTVSHYGFNYPLTYMPSIALYPDNLLSAMELQRNKVIAFIHSTAMSFVEHDLIEEEVAPDNDAEVESLLNGIDNTFKLNECPTLKRAEDNNGSFISVKEIQLEPKEHKRRSRRQSKSLIVNAAPLNSHNYSNDEHETELLPLRQHNDALSEPFSSMLSFAGTYPAASNSRSGDLAHEQDDHDHFDDSCDNYSSLTAPRHVTSDSENLYRSYVLRNFLPINHHNNSRSHQDIEQHKPESDQALNVDIQFAEGALEETSQKQRKHISLSLNSLKRRALNVADGAADASHQRRLVNTSVVSEASGSSASLKSLEIHINVSIKNSDCAKNLQMHEQEFKSKLEKVIDEEISLISQQLATQNAQRKFNKLSSSPPPAPPMPTFSAAIYNQSNDVTKQSPKLSILESNAKSASTLRYRQTVALLEQELENLLNTIIRANELHTHAFMCDCKAKITQISEDIRASLSVENHGDN